MKHLKNTAPALQALAAAFDSKDPKSLKGLFSDLQDAFEKDFPKGTDVWMKGGEPTDSLSDFYGHTAALFYREDAEYYVKVWIDSGLLSISLVRDSTTLWLKGTNTLKATDLVATFLKGFDAKGFGFKG